VSDDIRKQATSTAGFIRAYGMFWRADEVDWYDNRMLLGRVGERRPKLKLADFWEQQGIYVLYNDHGPYYVGRTSGRSMNLGTRLSHHFLGSNGSPHRGKWDRFSWFGWRGVLTTTDSHGLQRLRKMPRTLLTNSEKTVQDLESLLIESMGTRHVGNARNESFAAAVKWTQVDGWQEDDYRARVNPVPGRGH
jgi:hypothetical protein